MKKILTAMVVIASFGVTAVNATPLLSNYQKKVYKEKLVKEVIKPTHEQRVNYSKKSNGIRNVRNIIQKLTK